MGYVQRGGVITKFDASVCASIMVSFVQFSNHGNMEKTKPFANKLCSWLSCIENYAVMLVTVSVK